MAISLPQLWMRSFTKCLPSMSSVQARGFSTAKLKVRGLSDDTSEHVLQDAFLRYGEIVKVDVAVNQYTGRPRGFGFVHFAKFEDADNALREMDGRYLNGRFIRVDFAITRPLFGEYPKAVGPPGKNRNVVE